MFLFTSLFHRPIRHLRKLEQKIQFLEVTIKGLGKLLIDQEQCQRQHSSQEGKLRCRLAPFPLKSLPPPSRTAVHCSIDGFASEAIIPYLDFRKQLLNHLLIVTAPN